MPRAPFQVLIVPFRQRAERVEFAVLRRKDNGIWQAVAGGGEGDETPQQGAAREVQEELSPSRPAPLYPLQVTASIPARFFTERGHWPTGTYVVPEYSFAADLTEAEITISQEHTAIQWLDCETAHSLLHFDSNRVALGELHERLLASDLHDPGLEGDRA
ncbi:NUDIX hydrolase [Streptomyces sp. NPDC002851]